MDIREHVTKLNETRLRVWNEARNFLDDCAGREMSAEERAKWNAYNERIDDIDAQVASFVATEQRERDRAVADEAVERVMGKPAVEQRQRGTAEVLRAWANGEGNKELTVDIGKAHRMFEAIRQGADPKEVRALLWDTGSVASAVPTDLASTLYQYMTASIAMMRMGTTKLFTDSGNNIDFPKVNAHGIATQVAAQGTALAGTEPTFAKMTLGAYKYGQLVQLSSETVQDTGVDILGFVVGNIGRALGELIDVDLVTGGGSTNPLGVMSAITGAGTIATGGSLIDPTYEKLVDLVYSVNGNYRARPSTAFLMRDLTAASVRKLRDGSGGTLGAVLWQPSLTNGIQGAEPDLLLGYPVYTDPNVASLASNAKVIAFGDFSAYYIRQVGQVAIERSDEYAFNTDLVTFRGKTRVDGDVIDTTALNIMKRSV